MLIIYIWTECGDRLNCNMRKKCKYGKSHYRLHNLSVDIHRFFEYRFHIKLPYLISFTSRWERLSGTNKCPYHRSRNYTCHDCKYISGPYLRDCSNEEYRKTKYKDLKRIETAEWGNKCGYFEKCEWADDYLKENK